ncbi:MAG: ATP-binding cassette domain-containing protein [Gemmatimonadota bacterium]|nr:ATP-binding cassette domain-containing protein [Gemmatimonadota bacterium]
MIKVENLTKYYGPTLAVDSVDFEITRGQVVGFLGPNGAGKTTTMRIVTCYLKPTSGTASVAGYDISDSPLEVRNRIGYLPENCPLYLDMNVVDYLHYIAELRQVPARERQRKVKEMIGIAGLGTVTHKDIGELSRGFRQRVGLAQAMVHDPGILILDEPTNGLDPNQIIEMRKLIREIGREKTIILSSHIMQEVTATCDRVLIINDGRLVAQGSPDELTSQAQGKETSVLCLKGSQDEIFSALRNAPFIESFKKVEDDQGQDDGGWLTLEVHSAGGDIREQLFRLAVEKNFPLRELRSERMSLEDVFSKITAS